MDAARRDPPIAPAADDRRRAPPISSSQGGSSAMIGSSSARGHFRSLRACLGVAALVVAASVVMPVRAAVWPVYDVNKDGSRGAVNRGVLQGFGDGSPDSRFVTGIHEGIDVLA